MSINMLKHLSPKAKEELRKVCEQIDQLQGHCKDDNERARLHGLYERRKAIIRGE